MTPIIAYCDSILVHMPASSDVVPEAEWTRARFYVENIKAGAKEFSVQQTDWEQSFNIRDSMMARNIFWLAGQYKGKKMMLWAHNSHLGNVYSDSAFAFRPMGEHLRRAYGQRYQNIAMLTGSGTYRAQKDLQLTPDTGHAIMPPIAGSVDAQLQAFNIPMFLLPWRNRVSVAVCVRSGRLHRSTSSRAGRWLCASGSIGYAIWTRRPLRSRFEL